MTYQWSDGITRKTPDRYDKLCQAERRMKFLEAWIRHFDTFIFQSEQGSLADFIDLRMYQMPELLEETTEVEAHG